MEIKDITALLKENGLRHYVHGCCIHYGKGNYDKEQEIDYFPKLPLERDFRTAFSRILEREKIKPV